uniref:Splicing factor YJU2 n=1 Tax=Meloidogyne enterolobii TaxID=390850 RepID=A0A6V7TRW1_MELEN|nr:unnamed protein product [Meloidogyne enterolobii]CAD2138106.1 unnamed protein product [Meloidogyne enterolobii]
MTGTERKVFQKYYPPDFDPSKIPKASGGRNRQFIQRVMTPFNMRCNTCSEYIYKGKKFNMRRETAEGESYLGLRIFRFYFRCPNCLAEITFKTDIQNVDYQAENGATRLFDVYKFWQEQEQKVEEKEKEEKEDAMKMLEKRTKMSKLEMEALGHIEELQEINRRQESIDTIGYLNQLEQKNALTFAERLKRQEEEDEREVERLVEKTGGKYTKRIKEEDEEDLLNGPSTSSSILLKNEVEKFVGTKLNNLKEENNLKSNIKPSMDLASKRTSNQANLLNSIVKKKKNK